MSAISDEQYRYLMELAKHFVDDSTVELKGSWTREVKSDDDKETFLVDYYKGQTEFKKIAVNSRYRTSVVLARLCTLKRHTNPDGTVFDGAHLHVYSEAYGAAMAYPISDMGLEDEFSLLEAFSAFVKYCKIKEPIIQNLLEA